MNRLNDLRGFVGLPGHETVGGDIDLGAEGFMMRLSDEPYEDEDGFI